MSAIIEIFKLFKYKLTLIYVFMLITELSIIIQPYLLGKAIDDLIIGGYVWFILLGVSFFIHNIFHYKRMVYDTKVYTSIYNAIVFKFLNKKDVDPSTKTARTDMANQIVDVLEGYVHYYIATIVTIFGAIFYMLFTNVYVLYVILISAVFIVYGVMKLRKKIKQSISVRNNHYELKVKALSLGNNESISFFNRLRRLNIFESTLQGKNWFLAGTIKNIFLLIAIIILIKTSKNITIGNIITTYGYINSFLISLMSIPVVFEMYSRISDILKRL